VVICESADGGDFGKHSQAGTGIPRISAVVVRWEYSANIKESEGLKFQGSVVDIYIDTSEVNSAVHNCQITQVWKVAQDGVQIWWEKHTAENELPERGKETMRVGDQILSRTEPKT
jgi:hypothetical protein